MNDKQQNAPQPLPVPEYVVLQEVLDDWMGGGDGASSKFVEQVEAYYGNLMDDLHDSKGDPEYQAGLLDRMRVVESWIMSLPTVRTFTDQEKRAQQ
jgi:hypothetical protein